MQKAGRLVSITAVGALAMAGSLFVTGCDRSDGANGAEVARPAKLFTVRASGENAPRVFPGQVQAAKRVPLSFRVGGPVVLFQDMRDLEVVIDVPEREVSALTRVAPKAILVRFDAFPKEEFAAETAVYDFLKDWAEVQRSVADLGPDR